MTREESRVKRQAVLWIGILLLAASTETVAQQCFDEAPSVLSGGGLYESIAPTRLATKEWKEIERLFERLEGRWSGSSKGYFCRGRKGAARKEADDYRIEMNATRDNPNELLLTSSLTSSDGTTSRSEKLHLFLSDNTLRADRNDRAGDVRILQMPRDGSSIEFLQKVITRPASGGVEVRETLHRIHVPATSLVVEYSVYFIGGLASESTWRLMRK